MKKLLFIIMTLFVVLTTNAQQTACVTLLSGDTLKTTENHIDYYTLHDSLVRAGCSTLHILEDDTLFNTLINLNEEIRINYHYMYQKYMITSYNVLTKSNNLRYWGLDIAIDVLNKFLKDENKLE